MAEKVGITMRALIQRINRKLRHEEEMLLTLRGQRDEVELGRYYVVNVRSNRVVAQRVDPAELGAELGVLRAWEEVRS
jgi:predicted metalloprotease